MESVNEQTTCQVTIAFYDEHDNTLTPDSISYILYDKFSGTQRATGTLTPNTSVTLEITPSQNNILDQTNRYEIAVLQVTFISDGKQATSTYSYKIVNLSKVT